MNDGRLFIGLMVFLCLIGGYLIEVVFGSCPEIFDAELGLIGTCNRRKRLSRKEFFCRYLPLTLAFTGLPLFIVLIY